MLVDQSVAPGWMVALIVVREFLVTALRLAALERGVVLHARDLGKLKTWSQAVAAAIGGLRRGRRLARRLRLVGAARRARADVDLGAGLRARRAAAVARRRARLRLVLVGPRA